MNNRQKNSKEIKDQEKISYISFYSKNLKYYFTGFCIAIGIFTILFVLGIISFNRTPQILNNQKTINYLDENAFGELINTGETIHEKKTNTNTIIYSYPILYHIGEKQIPNLGTTYYIIKKGKANEISINSLIKDLRLSDIKTKSFKDGKIENILFKVSNGKYYISIDLNHHKIEIFNADQGIQGNIKTYDEKDIKKHIKSELNELGLTLKYYSDPIIIKDEKSSITLLYPRNINGIEIRNSEEEQEGLIITFDKEKGIITDISNYDTDSYQLSKYSFSKTKNQLLDELKMKGNIDTTKKGEEGSISMEKGKLIYMNKDEFLVPALLFKSNTKIEKNIILPLF